MRQIVNGLWQLSGFPQNLVNVYLMEDVLVDAGTRWARSRILRQLRGRQVRMVALTHCHPDHQGAAAFICKRLKVPLACHEGDVPAMEGKAPVVPQNRIIRLGERFLSGPPYPVGRVLHAGDEVAGFRVVHAPGHTPGHVIYFREADGVAIAGDLLANIHFLSGKTGLREPPTFFTDDPPQNRRSIQTLVELRPRVVCFGHGPPLRQPDVLEKWLARRLGRMSGGLV